MTKRSNDYPTYIEQKGEIRKFRDLALVVKNIRLVGETGTGKSFLVTHFSRIYQSKLLTYSLCHETTRWDLVASDILEKGSSKVRKGIIPLWLESKPDKEYCQCKSLERIRDLEEKPLVCLDCERPVQFCILFLDEWNYARPDVKSLVNELSDFRQSIWIPELARTMRRQWYHILVIAHNPHERSGYVGTYEENIAQVRRFETIRLYWLEAENELDLLLEINKDFEFASKLVEFANKIRTLYQLGELSNVITTQNLKNYMTLKYLGLGEEEILEIASDMYPYDEKGTVKRLWELPREKVLELVKRKGTSP